MVTKQQSFCFRATLLFTVLFSLVTNAADLGNKPKPAAQKKEATYALAYTPYFGVYGEMKVYGGLSVLAGFYTVPKFLDLKLENTQISSTTLYLGTRYYLTGEPIRNGLFLQYSLGAKGLGLHLNQNTGRAVFVQNTLSLGYRWAVAGSFFCDFGGRVSSNFVYIKDPNGYGNVREHVFSPDLMFALGFSF